MSLLPNQKLRAVVFDLDGTLIDSAPDIRAALNRVLAEAERPALDLATIKLLVGDGARSLVARGFETAGGALAPPALDAAYARFLALYEGPDATGLTRPYPGVVETLGRLRDDGFKLGVCTNKPDRATEEVLDRLDLARFFDAAIGPDHVPARKPDPAHLQAVLAALAVERDAAVMVGDNANDVAVARAAGVPVVAVSYGYPRMAPQALGADVLIDRMTDLPAALQALG